MALGIYFARADLKKKKQPQTTTQDCKHAILQIAHKQFLWACTPPTFCGMFNHWWLTTPTFNFFSLYLKVLWSIWQMLNSLPVVGAEQIWKLKVALPMTWEKNKQSSHWFWKHILKLSALSIFNIQITYFHEFKSGILYWVLKATLNFESKTSTSSTYLLLFNLFSCHPEAATPYLAAKQS